MTTSRGLMRVLLAAVAWAGVLVTYGATQSVINASVPIDAEEFHVLRPVAAEPQQFVVQNVHGDTWLSP
jgi:hypothetical protein